MLEASTDDHSRHRSENSVSEFRNEGHGHSLQISSAVDANSYTPHLFSSRVSDWLMNSFVAAMTNSLSSARDDELPRFHLQMRMRSVNFTSNLSPLLPHLRVLPCAP